MKQDSAPIVRYRADYGADPVTLDLDNPDSPGWHYSGIVRFPVRDAMELCGTLTPADNPAEYRPAAFDTTRGFLWKMERERE